MTPLLLAPLRPWHSYSQGNAHSETFRFAGSPDLSAIFVSRAPHARNPGFAAGIPFGLISTAILTVNNLRDVETDSKSGKRSLAVRFGRNFARFEYLTTLLIAVAIAVIMAFTLGRIYLLICLAVLPSSIPVIRTVFRSLDGDKLNEMLAATGRLLIIYGILFSIGWAL